MDETADDGYEPMTGDLSRRRLLNGIGVGIAASAAGCLIDESRNPGYVDESVVGDEPVAGRAVDRDGEPITSASVEVLRRGSNLIDDTVTDDTGTFELDVSAPAWLRVDHEAYVSQCRAVAPGDEPRVVLSPREDTVSLSFAGDVMFGRRFYEPDDDPLRTRYRIDGDDLLESHRGILEPTSPLLKEADITSVNLESALTTSEWVHPTKTFTYKSHPVAARALEESGVDYTALGNNHVFDALEPGFAETVDTLNEAGLRHSGAGRSSDAAWEPATVERNGLEVAFISCATLVGVSNEIDWSADRGAGETHTVEQGGRTLSFPADMGVAEPTPGRLRENVVEARTDADVVVVQIHGGDEFQREPDERIEKLTEVASDAGADLVVNHHPHVTGGLEYRGSTLVAWTLGNYVFDQNLWETLRSYVLQVEIGEDGISRAAIEPILIEGYVPKGVTGEIRTKIQRATAGLSSEDFALSRSSLEDLRGATVDPTRSTRSLELSGEEAIFARETGWIDDVRTGTVRLGRDRLLTGGFGDDVVDDERFGVALWRYGRTGSPTVESDFGTDGTGGVRLSRHEGNDDRKVVTPRHRLPVDGEIYTLTGRYMYNDTEGLEILVSWYDDTSGGSFDSETVVLPETDRDWRRFAHTFDVPEEATHVNFFAFLSPPTESKIREASFDEFRLIEWADANVSGGRQYDHAYVDGSAVVDVETTGPENDEAEVRWTKLDA